MNYMIEWFRTLQKNYFPKPPEGLTWYVGEDRLRNGGYYTVSLTDEHGQTAYSARIRKSSTGSQVHYLKDLTWKRIRVAILDILEQRENEDYVKQRAETAKTYLKGTQHD